MTEPTASTVNDPATDAPAGAVCGNCGTALLGPHCYRCGQPVRGLVRHFSSILGDFLDSVFNIDARVFRTLWPLFAKPGYLTLEYFAGRRVRYVSPVRLFFFLSIVAFFVAQFGLKLGDGDVVFEGSNNEIRRATTVQQVEQLRDEALRGIEAARQGAADAPPVADAGLDAAESSIRESAEARIDALQKAKAAGKPPPEPDKQTLQFNDRPWNAVTNPLVVDWLPAFANRWINTQVRHAQDNIARIRADPNLFKNAVLGALPSTLFVLLPIFALLLKIAYLFKHRLYMEHLIVALHSHAFLCLALLLMFLLNALDNAMGVHAGGWQTLFNWLVALLWIWMLLYLLLMQKRIYRQGWIMTLLKYFVLGTCYIVLLSLGVSFTMLLSLVWM